MAVKMSSARSICHAIFLLLYQGLEAVQHARFCVLALYMWKYILKKYILFEKVVQKQIVYVCMSM